MRKFNFLRLLFEVKLTAVGVLFLLASCKKEIKVDEPDIRTSFPKIEKDITKVATNRDVTAILKVIYRDKKVLNEVKATILSGYYKDERVLLKDLLYPSTSPLYQSESFKKYPVEVGVFKRKFSEELDRGDYQNLKSALRSNYQRNINSTTTLSEAPDPDLEIFSNSSGTSIYFPYSENFGTSFTTSYFDNINTSPTGEMATIVNADRDADSGPGDEPYVCGTRTNQSICYTTVTVDDAYAEINPTHIVGVGAEPAKVQSSQQLQVDVVFNWKSKMYRAIRSPNKLHQ